MPAHHHGMATDDRRQNSEVGYATLTETDRRRVAKLVENTSLARAALALGVGREAVARCCGALRLQPGTELQIAIGLATLDGEGGARGSPPAGDLPSSAAAVTPDPTETR